MEEYEAVWRRFVRERRLEFGGHMDPDWQGGHRFSASLVVPGEASRFHERLNPFVGVALNSIADNAFAGVSLELPARLAEVTADRPG